MPVSAISHLRPTDEEKKPRAIGASRGGHEQVLVSWWSLNHPWSNVLQVLQVSGVRCRECLRRSPGVGESFAFPNSGGPVLGRGTWVWHVGGAEFDFVERRLSRNLELHRS